MSPRRILQLAFLVLVLVYPLFLVIFGRNALTIIMIGFVAALPPVILKTLEGLSGTRPVLINVGRSFKLTPSQLDVLSQQDLQVRLDAVLHQTRVDPEFVAGVVLDILKGDPQLLACLVLHHPDRQRPVGILDEPARRAHPVQRLVGAVIGVHADRAVGLEQQ